MEQYDETVLTSTKPAADNTVQRSRPTQRLQPQPRKGVNKAAVVTIGAVGGVMLGAAAAFGAPRAYDYLKNHMGSDNPDTPDTPDTPEDVTNGEVGQTHPANLPEGQYGQLATNVSDDMSFQEAFDAAREEVGAGGVFHWHGNAYSTFTTDEWESMTDEQHDAYSDIVRSDAQAYEQQDAPELELDVDPDEVADVIVEEEKDSDVEVLNMKADEVDGDVDFDVEVLALEDVQLDDGSVVTVGAANIDDQEVYFIDADNDGVFDVSAVDLNENGQIDEGELIDISEAGITVEEFGSLLHREDVVLEEAEDMADTDLDVNFYDESDMGMDVTSGMDYSVDDVSAL